MVEPSGTRRPRVRIIEGHAEIREAYRDQDVARRYIGERFREPLGALLHARQARSLTRLVRRAQPATVLEIAPGPARLTVDVCRAHAGSGVVVDASAQMLAEARRRLAHVPRSSWHFVQGDVFNLPVNGPVDFVYAFRLIRHFGAPDRRRIYDQLAAVIRPGGLLVFDAINREVAIGVRARAGGGRHYDALLTREELREELDVSGFDLVTLEGVQHNYGLLHRLQVLVAPRSRLLARLAMDVVDRFGGDPLEWVVTCRRR